MGGLVEDMLRLGLAALTEGKPGALPQVHEREDAVNALHREIDARCVTMIARFQPAADDARFVGTAGRMNADLERIGDQGVNIAQNVDALLKLPPGDRPLLDAPRMGRLAL